MTIDQPAAMRSHAQEAVAMGGGKTRDEIAADRKLQLRLDPA